MRSRIRRSGRWSSSSRSSSIRSSSSWSSVNRSSSSRAVAWYVWTVARLSRRVTG